MAAMRRQNTFPLRKVRTGPGAAAAAIAAVVVAAPPRRIRKSLSADQAGAVDDGRGSIIGLGLPSVPDHPDRTSISGGPGSRGDSSGQGGPGRQSYQSGRSGSGSSSGGGGQRGTEHAPFDATNTVKLPSLGRNPIIGYCKMYTHT